MIFHFIRQFGFPSITNTLFYFLIQRLPIYLHKDSNENLQIALYKCRDYCETPFKKDSFGVPER